MIFSKYTPEELEQKGDSQEEWSRLRSIFEEIKNRILNNKPVGPREIVFFLYAIELLGSEGEAEDFKACEDWLFKEYYLRYWENLDGIGEYVMMKKIRGRMVKTSPSKQQIENEIKRLEKFAEEWSIICQENTNNSDEVLRHVAKETNDNLKTLDKNPVFNFNGYLIQSRLYDRWRLNILLRLKYAYLLTLEILDEGGNSEYPFQINGDNLVFNSFSSIHIINRHYAVGIKVINLEKSHHSEIIMPRSLVQQLGEFIGLIEHSGLYKKDDILKILFNYKGINFSLRSKKEQKQVKGVKGNVSYNRIQTLYPITKLKEISDMNDNYICHQINSEFAVYIRK